MNLRLNPKLSTKEKKTYQKYTVSTKEILSKKYPEYTWPFFSRIASHRQQGLDGEGVTGRREQDGDGGGGRLAMAVFVAVVEATVLVVVMVQGKENYPELLLFFFPF